MFIDSWGDEHETKEEAIAEIHDICKEHDYWEMVGEYMNIDCDIMRWIIENHLESFRENFEKQILEAENDWCEMYIEELEEI